LASLYVLDHKKDGVFDLLEMELFIKNALSRHELLFASKSTTTTRGDFQANFHGYCSWLLFRDVSSPDGLSKFVEWFLKLVKQADNPSPKKRAKPYVSRGAIQFIHKLLRIKKAYGLGDRKFFLMLQMSGEEQNLLNIEDKHLDDFVPDVVVEQFGRNFIGAYSKFLLDLGFDSLQLPSIPISKPSS